MAPKGKNTSKKSSSSSLGFGFLNKACERKYHDNLTRLVIPGLSLPPNFLLESRFDIIHHDLDFQGLLPFLTLFQDYDELIVRQFYANWDEVDDEDDEFITMINNKQFPFNVVAIRDMLDDIQTKLYGEHRGIFAHDFSGAQLTDKNCGEYIPGYSVEEAWKSLCDTQGKKRNVSHLTAENRMLHHIVTHTILPRGATHSVVSEMDIAFMYFTRNRIKINIPHLILNHIVRIERRNIHPYAYAMHISKYFMELRQVPQASSKTKKLDSKTNQYSKKTLGSMFTMLGDAWVRKLTIPTQMPYIGPSTSTQHEQHDQDFSVEDDFFVGVGGSPPPRPPTLSEIQHDIVYLRDQQDVIRGELVNVNNTVARVESKVDTMMDMLKRFICGGGNKEGGSDS